MRGNTDPQEPMCFAMLIEERIPKDHPLRPIRKLVNEELRKLSPRFEAAYSKTGRPSIPPEQLLKSLLLQALYSIPSERKLCEHLAYNILFQWFVGLRPDDKVWDPTTFTQNRDRFEEHGLLRAFFESTVTQALALDAKNCKEFSVDGTLIQSWASMKSFRSKDDIQQNGSDQDNNSWGGFAGKKLANQTHESTTDPEARLYRKSRGQESKLYHSLHVLMQNHRPMILDLAVAAANGRSERREASKMLTRVRMRHKITPKALAADKGYDAGRFLKKLEDRGITPLVAIRKGEIVANHPNAKARQRARQRQDSPEYQNAQRHRRRIEPILGWLKNIAGLKRTRFVGRWKTRLYAYIAGAGYNFMRLAKMSPA